jgi:6-phosphofructokinase
MAMTIRRIGILTGGGDAPGLNAVIRAAVLAAQNRYGWEVVGIREGFDGLLAGGPTVPLTEERVRYILGRGGTILGAVNRGNPFMRTVTNADGSTATVDISAECVDRMAALEIDALIVAGGDGTMAIAHKCVEAGARIVGVPKTIDNDLAETDVTFGFDTAILTATDALDKLQTTAESHLRVMVLEVMGRNSGWIALLAGVAGGADAILIPEIPFDISVVCSKISALAEAGRRYSLVVHWLHRRQHDRGLHRRRCAGNSAGALAARRRAHPARPLAGDAIWRGGGQSGGGGAVGIHGGAARHGHERRANGTGAENEHG